MANVDLQDYINKASDGDTITHGAVLSDGTTVVWKNSDTLLVPGSCVAPTGFAGYDKAKGWLVNKEVAIIGPHPRKNLVGAGGAKITLANIDHSGFNLACRRGNITIKNVIVRGQANGGSPTGLGKGLYTNPLMAGAVGMSCSCTNLSTVITGLASTATLFPGCLVAEGSNFPAGTLIVSVDSSSQVTVSAQYTGSTGSKTVNFGELSHMSELLIDNCVFWGNGSDGIHTRYVNVCHIFRCSCSDNGGRGIHVQDQTLTLIDACVCNSNNDAGILLNGCVSSHVERCGLSANCRDNATEGQIASLGTSGGGYGNTIEKCDIEDFAQWGGGTQAAIAITKASGPAENTSVHVQSIYTWNPDDIGGEPADEQAANSKCILVTDGNYTLGEQFTLKHGGTGNTNPLFVVPAGTTVVYGGGRSLKGPALPV